MSHCEIRSCLTILRSCRLVDFQLAPDPVRHMRVPLRVATWSDGSLRTFHLSAIWHTDQPAIFMLMMRFLSYWLNCEKHLLTRLTSKMLTSKLQRHCSVCDYTHWHQTWIIWISDLNVLICKVTRLYLSSFLMCYFQYTNEYLKLMVIEVPASNLNINCERIISLQLWENYFSAMKLLQV